MKIRNISCTQFAGIRNSNVSFTDGINVVYGKNESGKSTLVNLISRTLFQNARLDRRSDKDFFESYFPGVLKGGARVGDFADGKITIETPNGTYTLSKEWGAESRCTLSTPDGIIRDQKTIDAVLKEALLYGEGVYSDMLFSSQRNTDASLQTILDASKKTDAKQEIINVVSQAFSESDGVSADAIEQAIRAKIDEIAGKHWDVDRNMPVRKLGRWSNGLGEILKAYYAWEDAKTVLDEISKLEKDADRATEDFTVKDNAVRIAEEAHNRFNAFANFLTVQSERKKNIDRINNELAKIESFLSSWPTLNTSLEKAKKLKVEKTNRELLDKYEAAKRIVDEINGLSAEMNNKPSPTKDEIMKVRTSQRDVTDLENKLCGMNLTAVIKMLGDNSVDVTSLRTGKAVNIDGETAAITEAVKITVPGVMEMQLTPANVNIAETKNRIALRRSVFKEIFDKYQVDSLDALERLESVIAEIKNKLKIAESKLESLLGTETFAELETAVNAITCVVRNKDEIENDILNICGSADVARYIASKETIVAGYIAEYGSVNELKAKAYDLKEELSNAQNSMSVTEDIPGEYLNIADPEAHLETLRRDLELKRASREEALTSKTSATSRLESYKENVSGDPVDEFKKAERIFNEQSALLKHWLHIEKVFKQLKESINNNPMQDIADRFTYYLGFISNGKVSSEFPDADKLNMNIYSDNRLLDHGKLSEGTKETVSLAFRLAVLDHLFPEGGGVIVLDDPFTDMDAERTAQSCELIKECAKKHQVIFLTCKEEYAEMLDSNKILV